jgi:hypothetical protein
VLERISGADAYVVQFRELNPELDVYRSVQRIPGPDMNHWLFFDSLTEVKDAVRQFLARSRHQHQAHERPN